MQVLIELKGKIYHNTITVGDINIALLIMDGTSRQKFNKETSDLENTR